VALRLPGSSGADDAVATCAFAGGGTGATAEPHASRAGAAHPRQTGRFAPFFVLCGAVRWA